MLYSDAPLSALNFFTGKKVPKAFSEFFCMFWESITIECYIFTKLDELIPKALAVERDLPNFWRNIPNGSCPEAIGSYQLAIQCDMPHLRPLTAIR
jgi:hypothetical protein